MRILADNLFMTATSLSGTTIDSGYPVSNLLDRFLELRAQSTITNTTITASWPIDQCISAVAVGFTNATSGTYTVKDSGGSTIATGALELDYDTNMTYFTEVTTARSIEIYLSSSTVVYVGGLSCGCPFENEYWNVNPRLDFPAADGLDILQGGQSIGIKSARRIRWRATCGDLTLSQVWELKDILDDVGGWFPVYADLYEESHSVLPPIYGIMQGDNEFVRDSESGTYSTTIVIEGVR